MASSLAGNETFERIVAPIGSSLEEPTGPSRHSALKSPILVFLFFHKAIRVELDRVHHEALAIEKGSHAEIRTLLNRYHFLRVVYKHHSNAEDEVIFPALDMRVKNVALTYSLEHKGASDLFDHVFGLLNSAVEHKDNLPLKLCLELVCCTEAIKTSLCQHMSKEEEQVFPLLTQHFSFKEQASLVWQFMCSIPVNLMEEFLPWLVSSLSIDDRKDMIKCMRKIVPEEALLQEVVFTWLKEKRSTGGFEESFLPSNEQVPSPSEESWCVKEVAAAARTSNQGSIVCECCKKMCKRSHFVSHDSVNNSVSELLQFPINEILHWHKAISMELKEISEEARRMQHSGDFSKLPSFNDRLQFCAEVCIFHSVAEDKVVFPAVGQKVKKCVSYVTEHAREKSQMENFQHLIENIQNAGGSLRTSEVYSKLSAQAELIMETVQQHFLDEEFEVLPLAREHCSIEEQRNLLYQSLRVMPLKLLERALPWLVAVLSEEEANEMLWNMQLAAPVSDMALVTLFTGWACKGHPKNKSNSGGFICISLNSENDCPLKNINEKVMDLNRSPDVCATDLQSHGDCGHVCTDMDERPLKRPHSSKKDEECSPCDQSTSVNVMGQLGIPCLSQPFSIPGLGMSGSNLGIATHATGRNLRSFSFNSIVNPSISSSLFGWGSDIGLLDADQPPKPIDHIFQFHKAIRKDLEYLDVESVKLMNCSDAFLRQFSGRFHLLWGLYRAHSSAEDEIVFPALEAKESLHNVSHSYTIDHKQEEKLFKDISTVLSELSQLHEGLDGNNLWPGSDASTSQPGNQIWKHQELSSKLQRMCKSLRVALDQHVYREELELWPLFDFHFSVEEQDKIVGQIIGTTGAEVLKTMVPWVITALTQEEQNTMMDTWRQATRNTMFDEWLSAWWKESPTTTPQSLSVVEEQIVPPSGTTESLQMVADYLSRDDDNTCNLNEETPNHSTETDALDGKSKHHDSDSKIYNGVPINNIKASECTDFPFSNDKKHTSELDVEQAIQGRVEQGNQRFKPGWQDIFRMNQEELESAIRKVSRDVSLDPRKKAYLIQNLMTSRWIAAQQKLPQSGTSDLGNGEDIPGRCPSYRDADQKSYGCEHYKRNCKVLAACCGQLFACRLCHDNVSDHVMDRKETKEMMCMKCLHIQPVAPSCATPSCEGLSMARYFCSICKFFDDERNIYHCPFCNLCRVGKGLGIDYFHCMKCNACMSKTLTVHKCREKGFESNCPICHEFIFTSSAPVKALPCGHLMHSTCFQAYTCCHYTCPICSKSLGDMTVYFGMLDALLAAEKLPEEYQGRSQDILCNDCEKKGRTPFHWLYHKCSTCGSYNTRVI